jgi:DNA modification methylase
VTPFHEQDNVTIYHGDCRDILPSLGPVALVLTDPPYARSATNKEWRVTASVAIGIHQAARLVSKDGAMLLFSTSSGRGVDFALGAVGEALPFNRVLTWHKAFVRSRVAGPWRWDSVLILGFGRCSFGRPELSSVFRSNGDASRARFDTRHPAELPEGITEWLYLPFSGGLGTVLDPFMGSGQLLRPAAAAGRRVIGIDVEERYCDMAAKRLSQGVLFKAGVA